MNKALEELREVLRHDEESCSMSDVDAWGTLALEWIRKHGQHAIQSLTQTNMTTGHELLIKPTGEL